MKKKLSYFLILLLLVGIGKINNIAANEINTSDISNSTYIIGKHMFTRETNNEYNGKLSTNYIMLAAKTITSDNLEDMIIYYKNARGTWINALTSEAIDAPEKFDIEYKNNEPYLLKPSLFNSTEMSCGVGMPDCPAFVPLLDEDGMYGYDLHVSDQNSITTYYEIYEIKGNVYELVASGEEHNPETYMMMVEPGEKKVYTSRVYIIKANGEKAYSDYSNEVVIDHSTYATPELINQTEIACGVDQPDCPPFVPTLRDGVYIYDLGIKDQNRSFTGYEIYEKNGTSYTKIGEGKVHNPEVIVVEIEPGEKKVYVARIYAQKANGYKVYSDYSNEVVIDHSTYETPTLLNQTEISCGVGQADCPAFVPTLTNGVYNYDLGIEDQNNSFTGYEIYEKNGTSYTKIGEGKVHNPEVIAVEIEPGEKKVYVAKIYAENKNGDKIYSDYSNEVVIDHSTYEAPTLINVTGASCGEDEPDCSEPTLVDGKYNYDLGIKDQNNSFTGYEIYEKNGTEYTKVGEGKIHNPETIMVQISPGERKVYVARIYAENKNGDKIYSGYSNELIIEKN